MRCIEVGNVAVRAMVVLVGIVVVRERKGCWAHSSAWIEWLPAEQLVEGSSPSGPAKIKKTLKKWTQCRYQIDLANNDFSSTQMMGLNDRRYSRISCHLN